MINCKKVVDYYAEKKQMFKLLQQKWDVLKELAYILSISYNATISLQKKSLTLSDVFGIWTKMTLHISACLNKVNYVTNFAKHLLEAMNERKHEIFNNPMMNCALFLDPRFRRQIVQDEVKMHEAKQTLLNIWRRLITLNTSMPMQTDDSIQANTSAKSEASEFDENAELEKFLECGLAPSTSNESQREDKTEDIEHLLDMFSPEAIKPSENIIEYWENNKNEHKEIYKLATVVMGIPPTEVQSERDFSKLNYVFSDKRCNLTEERLEDIMTINLNGELFFLVKDEEINILRCKENM